MLAQPTVTMTNIFCGVDRMNFSYPVLWDIFRGVFNLCQHFEISYSRNVSIRFRAILRGIKGMILD